MRYVNGFFCVLLLLFAIAQYNDPDAILWIVLYGVPGIWAGLAAARPEHLARSQGLLVAFGATLVVIAGCVVYWWPHSIADWWDNELVREGLGMIIVAVALLVVVYTIWRIRRPPSLAQQAS